MAPRGALSLELSSLKSAPAALVSLGASQGSPADPELGLLPLVSGYPLGLQ